MQADHHLVRREGMLNLEIFEQYICSQRFFFPTFIYTDLIYRVCCWKLQKLNTTETEKKRKKTEEKKKYNERTKLDNN